MPKRRRQNKPTENQPGVGTQQSNLLEVLLEMTKSKAPQLLSRTEVEELLSVSRSWIYAQMNRGNFPRPLKYSSGSVRWLLEDIVEWLSTRPFGPGGR